MLIFLLIIIPFILIKLHLITNPFYIHYFVILKDKNLLQHFDYEAKSLISQRNEAFYRQ